jgi:hypothetical protein
MRGKRMEARSCFERARDLSEQQGIVPLRQHAEAALTQLTVSNDKLELGR